MSAPLDHNAVTAPSTSQPEHVAGGWTRRALERRAVGIAASWGAAAVTAACGVGGGAGEPRKPSNLAATLQLGYRTDPPDQETMKAEFLPRFAEENPNIKVEILTIGGNYDDAVLAAVAGGTAPDLLWVSHEAFPGWASKGILAKLEAHAKRDGKRLAIDDFYPSILESARYKRELYGMPFLGGIFVVNFNRKLFREAAAPLPSDLAKQGNWTEATFLKSAQRVKKATGADTAVFGVNARLNYPLSAPWLWGAGADFFTPNKTAFATDTAAAQAALQFQADLALKHDVAPKPGEKLGNGQNVNFSQQTLAMEVTWTTGTRTLVAITDLEWDAVPIPKGAVRSLSISAYNPLSITSLSKQADAAWELVGHLTGKYVVKTWTDRGRIMATRKSAAEQASFIPELPTAYREIVKVGAQTSAPNPIVVPHVEIARVVNPLMLAIASGEKTAREAGLEMKRLADPILQAAQ